MLYDYPFFFFRFLKKTLIEMCSHFQGLSKYSASPKSLLCKLGSGRDSDLPVGYRQVHIDWFDLDKCNVCHMDEVQGLSLPSCIAFACFLFMHGFLQNLFLFLQPPVQFAKGKSILFLSCSSRHNLFLFIAC